MEDNIRKIALFDMDGTLADYDGQLLKDLQKIASPNEPPIDGTDIHKGGGYLEYRRHMITSQVGWWLKLKKFQLGFDIIELCKNIGYEIVVLTKGPSTKYSAWSEKVEWCNKYLKEYIKGVTITNDKGLVYGKVLVDDFPDYIISWLKHRPRGLIIMPAHDFNKDFKHPNVVRYDGTNIEEVKERLLKQFNKD
jgi:phosphoglycolate phosphatase-like HAD superfamily hydrolase